MTDYVPLLPQTPRLDAETALLFLASLLRDSSLNTLQELVFQQAWERRTYQQIAHEFKYNDDYIRDVGHRLWRQLSKALGEKITKKNVRAVVQRRWQQRQALGQVSMEHRYPLCNFCQDWHQLGETSRVYGRTRELAQLRQWILGDSSKSGPERDRRQLINILGLAGSGKTTLAIALVKALHHDFEHVVWCSLEHAPPLPDLLRELLGRTSSPPGLPPEGADTELLIRQLLNTMEQHRCLIVLDGFETVLRPGKIPSRRQDNYRLGYGGYGDLLAHIARFSHRSCCLLTSRESPLTATQMTALSTRVLSLRGLEQDQAQPLMQSMGSLSGSTEAWQQLIHYYGGNPLWLKLVAVTIQQMFGGNLSQFWHQDIRLFGDGWDLLDQQCRRLTPLDLEVLVWLALAGEPLEIKDLTACLCPQHRQRRVLEALSRLWNHALIERQQVHQPKGVTTLGFTLQPVLKDYINQWWVSG
ncbi:NB-ARC domain-containing protein [Nodosilinea sp. P-1105]|uniref:NB-ARC domain-containing protein n=1 Tax=Nodosilinea sp. P-1105 TaxID=2546229 RepID=UPI00146A8EA3|nr:NB-ARC domain-containing protein [Nodosilinea sp. P-1105]NMF82472.1 NACHT domain-containing protein [Nodosilinea sp. P-1105]